MCYITAIDRLSVEMAAAVAADVVAGLAAGAVVADERSSGGGETKCESLRARHGLVFLRLVDSYSAQKGHEQAVPARAWA